MAALDSTQEVERLDSTRDSTRDSTQVMTIEERRLRLDERRMKLEEERLSHLKTCDLKRIELIEATLKVTLEHNNRMELIDALKSEDRCVQQYDASLNLIFVHDGLREAARSLDGGKESGIRTAARSSSLYLGYRWLFVDRDEHSSERRELSVTVEKKSSRVAQLTTDGTIILSLFDDPDQAAMAVGLTNSSSIEIAIKRHSVAKRYRWAYWDECQDDLKATFDADRPKDVADQRHETWVRKLTMEKLVTNVQG